MEYTTLIPHSFKLLILVITLQRTNNALIQQECLSAKGWGYFRLHSITDTSIRTVAFPDTRYLYSFF